MAEGLQYLSALAIALKALLLEWSLRKLGVLHQKTPRLPNSRQAWRMVSVLEVLSKGPPWGARDAWRHRPLGRTQGGALVTGTQPQLALPVGTGVAWDGPCLVSRSAPTQPPLPLAPGWGRYRAARTPDPASGPGVLKHTGGPERQHLSIVRFPSRQPHGVSSALCPWPGVPPCPGWPAPLGTSPGEAEIDSGCLQVAGAPGH